MTLTLPALSAYNRRTFAGLGDPVSDAVATWVNGPSPISASVGNFLFYGGLAGVAAYFIFFRGKHHRSGGGGHAPKAAAAPATAANRRRNRH